MIEAEPIASFVFECRTWLGIHERGMSEQGKSEAVRSALINVLFCAVVVCGGLLLVKQFQECRWSAKAGAKTQEVRNEEAKESAKLAGTPYTTLDVVVPDVVPQVSEDEGYDQAEPIL